MQELALYGSLFASAFLAATLLPVSSEAALLASMATGLADSGVLVAVAALGNTLGSVVNWALGYGVSQYCERAWFPVSSTRLDQAGRAFRQWGAWVLLLAWLPIIGDAFTIAAGVARLRLRLFLPLVAIGKTARYVAVAVAASSAGI